MRENLIAFLIAACTFLVGLPSFFDQFSEMWPKFKKLWVKLLWTGFYTLVVFFLSTWKDEVASNKLLTEKRISDKTLLARDLANKHFISKLLNEKEAANAIRINESNKSISSAFTSKLAEYGLRVDSNQHRIVKSIKDLSVNSDQVIGASLDEQKHLKITVRGALKEIDGNIYLQCYNSPARSFVMKYYIFTEVNTDFVHVFTSKEDSPHDVPPNATEGVHIHLLYSGAHPPPTNNFTHT